MIENNMVNDNIWKDVGMFFPKRNLCASPACWNQPQEGHDRCDICEKNIAEEKEIEAFYSSDEFQGGK